MVQKVSGLDVHTSIPSLKKEIPFDFGILAVKSYDTHKFLGSIRKYASFLPPILCLQNGVENESLLVEVFGEDRVIAGSVTTAIGREGPGVISVEKLRGVGIAGASPLVPAIVRAFNAGKVKSQTILLNSQHEMVQITHEPSRKCLRRDFKYDTRRDF